MTSSVAASTTQLTTFFDCRVAAVVELLCHSAVCRRLAAGFTAADTAIEAAGDSITPAWTGQFPMSTVDSRLAGRLRAVDVPSREVGRSGVVLRLTVESLAAGQQTEHTA